MTNVPQPNARHLMLSRFRKGKQSVPGTYMSAAGIQSELSPNCLHKIAVHEAVYRKHVNIYRQDLQQKVDKLKKNQNVLKKSVQYYRVKKRENRKKRYHPNSSTDMDALNDNIPRHSKQMLIIVDENGKVSKPVPIKRKDPKSSRESGSFKSPSLVSDSGVVIDFKAENQNTESVNNSSPPHDELHIPDISLTESFSEDLSKSFSVRQSASDLTASKPIATDETLDNETRDEKVETKPKLRRKGTIEPPTNDDSNDKSNETEANEKSKEATSQKPKKKSDKQKIKSQSLDQLPSGRSEKQKESKTERDVKSATEPSTTVAETGSLPLIGSTGSSNKDVVDQWLLSNAKKTSPKKTNTQTSAFMQLVRMKQTHSMSKHMNMIDKLISGSKNKRLVYLRRISEVSDTPIQNAGLRGTPRDNMDTARATSSDDVDGSEIIGTPTKHVKLPPIENPETEQVSDNPVEERFKRVMRKMSVAALQAPDPMLFEAKEESLPIRDVVDSPKTKTKPAKQERLLPSEQVSSRDIDKFIKNESAEISSYGRNVTWQESLAKLRDVHYVFPSKIVENKGFRI